MFLAKRIKEQRKLKGMTQEELGNALGVSKVSICYWERGVKKPSTKNLITLSKIFNVNVEYLIGSDTYIVKSEDVKYGFMMADEEIAFIEEIRKHTKLYNTIIENPKRALDRIDKLLF